MREIFLVFVTFLATLWLSSLWSKYDGLSAKEWAGEYNSISDCSESVLDDIDLVKTADDLRVLKSNLYQCL